MDNYVGEIRVFAGNFAPANWAFCNGQLLSISENQVLFTLIGTTYGGDGVQTFALPNLQGRAAVHQGTGPGLSTYVQGQSYGVDSVTLLTSNQPLHSHTLQATTATATSAAPANLLPGTAAAPFYTVDTAHSIVVDTLAPQASTVSTGGTPHDNSMPSLALNYIIALYGIFPSSN